MSQTVQKTPLAVARAHAEQLAEALRPGAYRLQIAGSIRRETRLVSDIEIVAVPDYAPGLFPGQGGASKLDGVIADAMKAGLLGAPIRNGEKWRTYPTTIKNGETSEINLDLFIVEPWAWGVMLMIRTGPAEFSKACVTQQSLGGLLRDDCLVRNGRVWQTCSGEKGPGQRQQFNTAPDGMPERWLWFQAQDTDEEDKFFEFVIGGYVEPTKR